MIWFAFLWSLARLNNFIFVCWPFIFVSYKQWFHLFFWGIARICVFYQICPDEADIQPSWLPRLQGMSSLAPSQKVDVLLTFSFWAAKQNILVNKTNSTTLHPPIQCHRKSWSFSIKFLLTAMPIEPQWSPLSFFSVHGDAQFIFLPFLHPVPPTPSTTF